MYDNNDSDCFDFGGDSDDGEESSEDDLDYLMHSSPEKRKQLLRKTNDGKQNIKEDAFEHEMNAELNDIMTTIELNREKSSTGPKQSEASGSTANIVQSSEEKTEFYDDIYFDSDDEEESSKRNKKRRIPTNDDLFYDPNMDEDDERWVANQRQRAQRTTKAKKGNKESVSRSDAVLNCPACMTTLCRDCQRHDKYENQYRAMFVTCCVVDRTEQLTMPEQKGKHKKWKKDTTEDNNLYNPVKCSECNTVVAMFAADEVYHFFNVLASY